VAGIVVTAAWVAGTAKGFAVLRAASRGSCRVPTRRSDGA